MVSDTQDDSSPKLPWPRLNFKLISSQNQLTIYIKIVNLSRGTTQLGWVSWLTSAGRVTLARGITFLHINALACQTGTTLGMASVTLCLKLGFLKQKFISEVNLLGKTQCDWMTKATYNSKDEEYLNLIIQQRSWIIMQEQLWLSLQGLCFHIVNARQSCLGESCHWYPRPYNWGLRPQFG